jgi:membrane protein YdbS with pleckstrin-like domain
MMRLLISKEGRQLGPYDLEEARALVLSGQLSATDWAWPDGARQWIALKDVPGFSPGATGAGTPPPPLSPAPIAEEEMWRGRPSQILNFKVYFFWTIVLLGTLSATVVRLDLWPLPAALAVIALLQITVRNLRIRSIQYIVSTQRVRIVSGLLNKEIQEIELFRVKDTMVHQRFFQRLFGLGTITVLSGDAHNPRLMLYGIPHAVELRERIRHEVMILRQRYGVREMDVM